MLNINLVAAVSAGLLTVYFYLKRQRQSPYASLPLPPGPKPLPIIGNLLQLPTQHEAQAYEQWGRDYGSDILYANVAGTSLVIINSAAVANELLEQRSSIYSSRPFSVMSMELMGFQNLVSLVPYGNTWRAMRRLLHQQFHPQASLQYRPAEIEGTHDFLRRLLDSPNDFFEHVTHLTGKVIMDLTYGIKVKPQDDPHIETAKVAMEALSVSMSQGAFYVDILPILKHVPEWMPGAAFKRKAREWHVLADNMFHLPYNTAKEAWTSDVYESSFVSKCLEALKNDDQSDQDWQESVIRETAGTMYAAGTDTMASTLKSFFLAMILNPEVQAKAQKELDEVVGHGNLPDFSHQSALPYIDGIVKESLRWRPVAPQGVPHVVTAEDAYEGYRIPVGSIVIPNVWAMLHNETVYPDSSKFSPERYLDSEGRIDPTVKDPAPAAFGFGRRVCPGRYMAVSTLYITIASVLAMFNIEREVDADGLPIAPSGEYTPSGIIVGPLPFKATIRPRSEAAKAAILAQSKEAETE